MIPIGGLTHYLGDAIALVAAESLDAVEKAKGLVRVEYEELPFIDNLYDARKEDAPLIHEHLENNLLANKKVSRGDAKAAIARSKYVLTEEFHTPFTEHAFLEPECSCGSSHRGWSTDLFHGSGCLYYTA